MTIDQHVAKTVEEHDKLPYYIQELKDRRYHYGQESTDPEYCLFFDRREKLPVAARGDLVQINGREKSRKSLFLDCIETSAFVNDRNNNLNFMLDVNGLPIIHIDSEQPKHRFRKTRGRFHRMCRIQNQIKNYFAFNLRPYSYRQRLEQVDYIVSSFQEIGVLAIDGIIDFAAHENDELTAGEAVARLMAWSDMSKALTFTILHTNRGGIESNGKIGSILDKKCDVSFLVSMDWDTKQSMVKHKLSRDKPIPDFTFKQNSSGYPILQNIINTDIPDEL